MENGDFSDGLASWSNNVDWSAGAIITAEGGAAKIAVDNASYNRYLNKTVSATTDFTHYEYVFKFPVEDTVSLKFLLGKTDSEVPVGAHEIIIDNVICQVKNAPPAPQPAALSCSKSIFFNEFHFSII